MEKRRWIYAQDALPKELEDEPRCCGERLTRLCISASYENTLRKPIMNVGRIEWKYCTKLAVLELHIFSERAAVLNLNDLVRLRSLDVHSALESIEGLEGLKSLTFFRITCEDFDGEGIENKLPKVGQLPASLKVLRVSGHRYDFVFVRAGRTCFVHKLDNTEAL